MARIVVYAYCDTTAPQASYEGSIPFTRSRHCMEEYIEMKYLCLGDINSKAPACTPKSLKLTT
jgi:hypothetical protein